MADSTIRLFKNTCSFLIELIDKLESNQVPCEDPDALLVSKELYNKLYTMTVKRTRGNIVLISEKLMNLFHRIQKECCEKGSCLKWYYCDLCFVETSSHEIWSNHLSENGHSLDYPETSISCETCGLCLYGLDENLHAYLNSPSHIATDLIKSKSDPGISRGKEVEPVKSPSENPHYKLRQWMKITKYAIISVLDNYLISFNSIKTASEKFGISESESLSYESMCFWINSYFGSEAPVIQCNICDNSQLKFSESSLWNHLISSEHVQRSKLLQEKKGFLACLDCSKLFIDTFSILINHNHGRLMTVLNSDLEMDNEQIKNMPEIIDDLLKNNTLNNVLKKTSQLDIDNKKKLNLKCEANEKIVSSAKSLRRSSKPILNLSAVDGLMPSFFFNSQSKIDNNSLKSPITIVTGSSNNDGSIEKQAKEKIMIQLLNNVVEYLLSRFTKEPICSCCASVYFCFECNFRCTYLPYWKKHLSHPKHKSNINYEKEYCVTDVCSDCGLQVFIECGMEHILTVTSHLKVDSHIRSLDFGNNSFYSNCLKSPSILEDHHSLLLYDILHTSACKHENNRDRCKYDVGPIFLVENFTLNSLEDQFNDFLSVNAYFFPQISDIHAIKFSCFLCNPIFIDFFSNFNSHMIDNHDQVLNGHFSKDIMNRIAVLCNECFILLVDCNFRDGDFSRVLKQTILNCDHKSVKNALSKLKNSKCATVKLIIAKAVSGLAIEHRDVSISRDIPLVSSEHPFSKMFEPIFNYLVDRYTKEPFCRDCATYYYCSICCFGTSYLPYWEKHCTTHYLLKHSKSKEFILHHCNSCGLSVYINKAKISLLYTIKHKQADSILEAVDHKADAFKANCKDILPKIEARNATFIKNIGHHACKAGCSLVRNSDDVEVKNTKSKLQNKKCAAIKLNCTEGESCLDAAHRGLSFSRDIPLESSGSTFLKMVEPIFNYLVDRYSKEPFCRDCATYYYCSICCYGTSYHPYWKQHYFGGKHSKAKDLVPDCTLHHCNSCGLSIYMNKDMIGCLDTQEHRQADSILKAVVHKADAFKANCKDVLPKIEARNATFIATIGHHACKAGCTHVRNLEAAEVTTNQPFIEINFSWAELKIKFNSYMSLNKAVLRGKMKFCCLDCEPTTEDKLQSLEDHLINKHGINSHKCLDLRQCLRVASFCCVCSTFIVSVCRKSIIRMQYVKGTDYCNHIKLLDDTWTSIANLDLTKSYVYFFSRLDEHMMNSGFKCSYLRDIVTCYCSLCQLNFKNIEDLCYHVSSPTHINLFKSLVLFFCYKCNKINLLNEAVLEMEYDNPTVCGSCWYFPKIFKLYLDMKKKCDRTSPFKDQSYQFKCLPDVTLTNNFKGGDRDVISCPVISNQYEFYNIVVTLPPPGFSATSIDSSTIYKDVSLSTFKKSAKSNKMMHIEYECLACNVLVNGCERFCSHLTSSEHEYRCYFTTQTRSIIPCMVFCDMCIRMIISDDVISLEKHLNSKQHQTYLRQTIAAAHSPYKDDELWTVSNLSKQCLCAFESRASLNKTVSKLFVEMESASKFYSKIKEKLIHDIFSAVAPTFPKAVVHFFGSRESGLAKRDSDIDVFVDLEGYYFGECEDVKKATYEVACLFKKNRKVFDWRRTIIETRVPLVKLWHKYYKINIDLNCLNSGGAENTKLLRFYLEFDERCRWLVAVIKEWASMNYLLGVRNGFNSYMLVWMVFFFLMQPEINIIPNVQFLKSHYKGSPVVMNGWDYSFCLNGVLIKRNFKATPKSSSLYELYLLKEFLKYYSSLETKGVFLCPLSGKIVPSDDLIKGKIMYFDALKVPIDSASLKLDSALSIMDPIVLNFNVTRNVHETLWKHFKILCTKMLITCKWLK